MVKLLTPTWVIQDAIDAVKRDLEFSLFCLSQAPSVPIREPRLDFGHPVDWPPEDGWDEDDGDW